MRAEDLPNSSWEPPSREETARFETEGRLPNATLFHNLPEKKGEVRGEE